jgi:uncharacterized protein
MVLKIALAMKNIQSLDWNSIYDSLNNKGYAHLKEILSHDECLQLIKTYPEPIYRNVINMQRYRFGKGEYKYYNYPLPDLIQTLRKDFYQPLTVIANDWMQKTSQNIRYPDGHSSFIEYCHQKKQLRPTPLILRYEPGGFNTLHQDLYGEVFFPFQIVFVLTQKGKDHDGGELVLTEQVPRAQSKAEVIQPNLGDAVIFTTNFRPVNGTRGYYKAKVKHGISEVKSGIRYALGIIFHDAS